MVSEIFILYACNFFFLLARNILYSAGQFFFFLFLNKAAVGHADDFSFSCRTRNDFAWKMEPLRHVPRMTNIFYNLNFFQYFYSIFFLRNSQLAKCVI